MLIAGTRTPIQGLLFRRRARWLSPWLMWCAVIVGVTFFAIYDKDVPGVLATGVFLVLGWIARATGPVLWRRLGTKRLWLLLGGGVMYSIGAVLTGLRWPTMVPRVLGPQELWHVAVLAALWMHWRSSSSR